MDYDYYESAEFLKDLEVTRYYLEEAFKSMDLPFILHALEVVSRAWGFEDEEHN